MSRPYITVRGGRKIHFLDFDPKEIKIEDIAWHLARQCRFNGHLDLWYSTAEHSINCANQAHDVYLKKICLIHDAAEFVFGDLVHPVKTLCSDYTSLIKDFESKLYSHFLGEVPYDFDLLRLKLIDDRMTATEMLYLRGCILDQAPYDRFKFACMDWLSAYSAYMLSFRNLFPEYKDVE